MPVGIFFLFFFRNYDFLEIGVSLKREVNFGGPRHLTIYKKVVLGGVWKRVGTWKLLEGLEAGKWSQEHPKCSQEPPRGSQHHPKTSQEAPRPLQEPIFMDLGISIVPKSFE